MVKIISIIIALFTLSSQAINVEKDRGIIISESEPEPEQETRRDRRSKKRKNGRK